MTTNCSINVPLAGSTGTGTFVGATSPTITTPKIAQINDTNGNAALNLSATGSAVNNWQMVNTATGASPQLNIIGTDTNIGMFLQAKGAGTFTYATTGSSAVFNFATGTGYQHNTSFAFANTAASQLVTFPDASGTVGITSTGSWTPIDGSGAGLSFSAASGEYIKIGNMVIATCTLTYPVTADISNAVVGGLPFTAVNALAGLGGSVSYTTVSTLSRALVQPNTTQMYLYNSTGTAIINSTMSTTLLFLQAVYFVS